jgi:hypothetical protein
VGSCKRIASWLTSALSVVKGKLSSTSEIRSSSAECLKKISLKEEELLEVCRERRADVLRAGLFVVLCDILAFVK